MTLVAEGDRVLTREEIVELADAVAGSSGIASGIGTTSYGAQLVVDAANSDRGGRARVRRVRASRDTSGPAAVADQPSRDDQRARRPGRRVIRLGSLAGYPFEGPRALVGWTPPARAAVYAIVYKPDPETKPDRYAVTYVDHADDLSSERFPFKHPRAACWVRRAGSRFKVYICTYEVPGGLRSHREQIARELTAIYRPSCNTEQYDAAWKDEWIGEYKTPTTGPLTTGRDPSPET